MSAPFDADRFARLAGALTLGRPLVATESTDSTNDDALEAARAGAPHGALFVTEAQRRGRGRRGNTWHAAPGSGLLFSLVLRPNIEVTRAAALSLVAGLAVRAAVAELLERAGVAESPLVKWPNDVLVANKKLAGVLVESQIQGGALGAVVVGIGLNLEHRALPEELVGRVTSLAALGVRAEREAVLALILEATEKRLRALESPKEPLKTLLHELRRFDALAGLRVSVRGLIGQANGVDAGGNLLVTDDEARTHAVTSGHVEVISDLKDARPS
jgi:BirA family biotin operon repressor/biotin-[acetyl-CoA-carboxylase] ligase